MARDAGRELTVPLMDAYAAEHRRKRLAWSGEPAWLSAARGAALERFLTAGFPSTRDEEWRFTSVAPIAERPFVLAESVDRSCADITRFRLAAAAAEIVFVDGWFSPELSAVDALPDGVRVESLRSVLADRPGDIEQHLTRLAAAERNAFTALNTAFLSDGACIRVADGSVLAQPIHVLFVATGGPRNAAEMAHPRVLAILGDTSQARLVESYVGIEAGGYFTNAVTEIVLGNNAVLEHCKLQDEDPQSYHVASMHVQASRSASLASHSLSLGGALARNDISAVLDGEGVDCTLNGFYIATGQRLVDNHTTIDHAKPHCGSREVYKGVLADRARGVFNGKIIVRADAQQTDAKQTNRALLLSEDAQINTKPQLEIFANDVKCTHGAAVGQLDDEAVFYLRSRGLSGPEARQLLIRAFAADVLNRVPVDSIRTYAEDVLLRRLAEAVPAAA